MTLKSLICRITLAVVINSPLSVLAQDPPDLTVGELGDPNQYKRSFVVGPTGIEGWAYSEGESTEHSRQILVRAVDSGSPADGLLQANDVILGVSGDGSTPVNFSRDSRRETADAINVAEALEPALLKLIRWRENEITTVTLHLETLGAYSSTAPYNCPKSRKILKNALDHSLHNQGPGDLGTNILAFLAADDPSDPNNAARMAKAREWAQDLIVDDEILNEWNTNHRQNHSISAWTAGHHLIVLSELYLQTQDETLLPAIYGYVSVIATGLNASGTTGHDLARVAMDDGDKRILTGGYGALNSAGLPCVFGMVLAKHCGIEHPMLDDALTLSNTLFSSFAGRGTVPYGLITPRQTNHETNGKSGLASLMFSLQDGFDYERNFYSKMAASASSDREQGHTGPFFGQLWTPLGAAVAGEEAVALYFKQIRWKIDLSRRWDGSFTLSALKNTGHKTKNASETWVRFHLSTAAILTYALPLRNLYITGRMHKPEYDLSIDELDSVILASTYDGASRTTDQLFSDLGIWSPKVKNLAGKELARRVQDDSSIIPRLIEFAESEDSERIMGACYALKYARSSAAAPVLASLLTHPETRLREAAAKAFQYILPASVRDAYVNDVLAALISTSRPYDPWDAYDPAQHANKAFAELVFRNSKPKGILVKGMGEADPDLFYGAIRAIKESRMGGNVNYLQVPNRYLSQDDFFELADVYVDLLFERPAVDHQYCRTITIDVMNRLGTHRMAEAVPLARKFITLGVGAVKGEFEVPLKQLENLAGSVNTVDPDPRAVEIAEFLVERDTDREEALAFLAAVAEDTDPAPLMAFKSISSVIADKPVLRLPERRTTFRVDSYDYARGDSVYTWRKIQGSGNAFITPNGTADADTATVLFDGTPGKYVFEVTMSDSRGLTEVSEIVAVTVNPASGSLPPNQPPTATPSSWTVKRATDLPIMLHGTDAEEPLLTYKIVNGPTNGELYGTPPSLIYRAKPGYLGADSFTFEVMDSEGETSSATVQLTVEENDDVGVAIYEPFDYPEGRNVLDGQSGSTEVGLTGNWDVNVYHKGAESFIRNASLAYGDISTSGSRLEMSHRVRAGRSIDPSALAENGLLNDGETLWGSFLMINYSKDQKDATSIALATDVFAEGAYIQNGGSGVGISMVKDIVRPAKFGNENDKTKLLGFSRPYALESSRGVEKLHVIKIQWGETADASDIIEVYQPLDKLVLPSKPISRLETFVNQADFDTLTINSRIGNVALDEIRFGPTYQSVLSGNATLPKDLTPPSAVAFLQGPSAVSATSITMTANASVDPSGGVEYYFTCVTGSGKDSGWQTSPSYTDTDLEPGIYGYTVKARDGSPAANETVPSVEGRATLSANTFMPDVTRVGRVDAESLLDYAGLRVGSVTYVRDSSLAPGTVMIQSPGMSPTPAVGTEVDLVIVTDNVTPLIRWSEEQGLHGLDARTTADPDGDRLINLVEFGLGLQPLANEMRAMDEHGFEHGLPSLASNHNEMEYYFIRRKDHSIPGSVAYTVQFSSDLVEFYDDFRTPTWVTNMADDDYELVKLSFPAMLPNGKPAQFARIQLTEIPLVD